MNRRQPIRRRSPKRAREEREYARLRVAFLEGHPLCQLCEEAPSHDVHHKAGRIGRLLTAVEHFIALCRHCHAWAHDQPLAAYRLGISERRIGEAS